MKVTDKTDFSWVNYMKPTPKNLVRFTTFLRDTLAASAGISVIMEHETLATIFAFSIIAVGQFSRFFSSIAEEEVNKKTPDESGA